MPRLLTDHVEVGIYRRFEGGPTIEWVLATIVGLGQTDHIAVAFSDGSRMEVSPNQFRVPDWHGRDRRAT